MNKRLSVESGRIKERKRTYVHLFEVITDCPFETAENIRISLLSTAYGYKYQVTEKSVLK